MTITCLRNGRLLRHHQLSQEDLWIAHGKVVGPHKKCDQEIDVEGAIIAPGFIDLQINGAYGVDFSTSPEKWPIVAQRLPEQGVTAFLPTVVSLIEYGRVLAALQPKSSPGAINLGIHLEGPFLQAAFRGAHALNALKSSIENLKIYEQLQDVRLVTLAPDLPGALKAIQQLVNSSIKISAGHSSASYEQLEMAAIEGLGLITHLFNGMQPFHHRKPGIIGYSLTHPKLFYSVIADGEHTHPAAIKIAWKCNPDGLFLISDAMAALGEPSGIYHLGPNEVMVDSRRATLPDGTLAGSLLRMDVAVKNFYHWSGCSLTEALEAASLKPAQALGIDQYKGHLNIGADADFIIIDDDFKIKGCYIGGKCAPKKKNC